MNISINANYLFRQRGTSAQRSTEECIKICAEAGYRVIDYSPNIWDDSKWEGDVDDAMNAAAKYGVTITQSHAPYNFYSGTSRERFMQLLDRSAEAAVRMGIRDLVFHADEYHPPKGELFNSDDALIQIYDILSPSIEKCAKGGVRATLETVFEDHFGVARDQRSHFCGDISELIAIIDKFNDPMVGCCWDFGHAKICVGNDSHTDAIRRMGKRIICTHVHDNYYGKDLHVPPFMGDANWEQLMPALREAGYTGDLTFELVYGNIYEDQLLGFLKTLYQTGIILNGMFEGK